MEDPAPNQHVEHLLSQNIRQHSMFFVPKPYLKNAQNLIFSNDEENSTWNVIDSQRWVQYTGNWFRTYVYRAPKYIPIKQW